MHFWIFWLTLIPIIRHIVKLVVLEFIRHALVITIMYVFTKVHIWKGITIYHTINDKASDIDWCGKGVHKTICSCQWGWSLQSWILVDVLARCVKCLRIISRCVIFKEMSGMWKIFLAIDISKVVENITSNMVLIWYLFLYEWPKIVVSIKPNLEKIYIYVVSKLCQLSLQHNF